MYLFLSVVNKLLPLLKFQPSYLSSVDHHYHHHRLPPWIRSLDLFQHRRFTIVSWGVHDLFFLEVCSWGPVSEVWCCPLLQDGWSSFSVHHCKLIVDWAYFDERSLGNVFEHRCDQRLSWLYIFLTACQSSCNVLNLNRYTKWNLNRMWCIYPSIY